MAKKDRVEIRFQLDRLYQQYNIREYVDPDPLLFLYDYPDAANREIVGLIAASLAYGRVEMIMKTVGRVLEKLKPTPLEYLGIRSRKEMAADFSGFVYRFARSDHLVHLLWEIKRILKRFGTLENCFCQGMQAAGATVEDGLIYFYQQMAAPEKTGHLMADPQKSSACKRSHLFLRWMVRCDCVDPGGWNRISPSSLVVPLDTHMYRAGQLLGFTRRKSCDRRTALEITSGFKAVNPQDPVKYDFCLTRFGIQRHLNIAQLKKIIYK